MLAARNRLRTPTDFSTTVRSGVRNGRRNVVLYAAAIAADEPSRIGFIVSKSVGNAVVRNLVKRRLREAGAASLREHGTGLAIVVRALPASASASWDQLLSDYNAALESTLNRLAGRPSRAAARGSAGTTQEGTPRA
ncbi:MULTISPECIES: ribonuclease P protein component [Pseudarthrobacter]|uniref:ribonuclease P protein component n=1 Tax=Pseudarthrobacter TaxID=1742993 RepID=UPI001132220F|nr:MULTISPECIES: ribonuclease P protein component [Pseudarthrobacter]QDG61778.1 ribonuclease P protein component [Pseudarthrobacter sp. NIBRBAC000502771]QDG90167.1 ribonuclease P protein component [Pseudarthrobacter sp. NIBRBAC000502770]